MDNITNANPNKIYSLTLIGKRELSVENILSPPFKIDRSVRPTLTIESPKPYGVRKTKPCNKPKILISRGYFAATSR